MTISIGSRCQFLAVLVVISSIAATSDARTWYLTVDGTGDAPFLGAAMDSATVGDTVLVAPGEYEIGATVMTNGVTLRSEHGPSVTRFVRPTGVFTPGAIACSGLNAFTYITGFWFDGLDQGHDTETGAISVHTCQNLFIFGNIFTNNDFAGITVQQSYVEIFDNTFVSNENAVVNFDGIGACVNNIIWSPIQGIGSFAPIACNDVLNINDLPSPVRFANFSADPMFCGENDFALLQDSPCAPGQAPLPGDCTLIGALPVGCSTTPTNETSWGRLKSIYQRH